MMMRLLSSGLLAGVLAGICIAAIQSVATSPIIQKAEIFEKAAESHHHETAAPHDHGQAAHERDARSISAEAVRSNDPAHEDGLRRTLLTSTATVGAAVGFALMLLAVMRASEAPISASTSALWGAAGFVATGLAPGLGLPPELPGAASADLAARQIWWISTAALSSAGLWAIWRWRTIGPALGGLALLAIPHVWGAPQAANFESTVPAELAARFTSTSLAVQAMLWVLVGAFAGAFWEIQGRSKDVPAGLPVEPAR